MVFPGIQLNQKFSSQFEPHQLGTASRPEGSHKIFKFHLVTILVPLGPGEVYNKRIWKMRCKRCFVQSIIVEGAFDEIIQRGKKRVETQKSNK